VHEEFERHPEAGMVYHRVHLWNGISDISEDTYFILISGRVTEDRRMLLQYPMVGTSCLAFRREALQKLLPVPGVAAIPGRRLSDCASHFCCRGCGSAGISGEISPARNELVPDKRGANLSQPDRTPNSHAGGASQRDSYLAAKTCEVTASPDIRAFLKQWTKAQESDEFVLRAPGRWKYFRHLLDFRGRTARS